MVFEQQGIFCKGIAVVTSTYSPKQMQENGLRPSQFEREASNHGGIAAAVGCLLFRFLGLR